MRKFIAGSALLLGALTASAQSFTEFPSEAEMQQTGGVQVLGMSSNGRYVIGSTYTAGGFVYDVEENKLHLTGGASGISDDGTAVAGLAKRNIHTGKTESLRRPSGVNSFLMTTGISADGNIVTGTGGADWTQLRPYYWEGTEAHLLPYPSTDEVGTFKVNGCRANGVSDDGRVIWGNFVANPNTNNLIIWERQADGTYEYVDCWTDLYEPQHGWVYDYDRGEYDFVIGPNPYCRLEPYAISGDGELILMRTQENTDEESPANKIGIFHVTDRRVELAPWSPDDPVGKARNFDSRGIANDGTVVGVATEVTLSDAVPFIMYPGQEPVYLNDAFPQFDRLYYYEDNSYKGLPYLAIAISSDGRFVGGYSTDIIWYEREVSVTNEFGFWGYVIDRYAEEVNDPENSAVEAIDTDDAGQPVYYTIDGIRIDNPSHGLYIKRTPDGRTTKIIL